MIDLILKEIEDRYTRENFARIRNFIDEQAILNGDFRLFDKHFTQAETNFQLEHELGFVPRDYIVLSIEGNQNVEFDPGKFTKDNFNITVAGPCRVRFLAGSFLDDLTGTANDLQYVAKSNDVNVDGGFATDVYLPSQLFDGGNA